MQTVNRATPGVGFNSSLNPSTSGDAVTFSAFVNNAAATGTVTFRDGTTVLGTNPLAATPPRIATLTTSSLSPGLHSITVTYDGDTNFNPVTSGVLTQSVYALFGAPPGLVASATSNNSVTINWVTVAGADHYELVQTSGAATPVVTTPAVNTATVGGLTPGTTYLYKVRAVSPTGTMSGYSAIDPATTIIFTDDPIVAGVTTVRAAHITELRQGVNAMRASVNLVAFTFTDAVVSGSIIKAIHLNQLRAALTEARTAMALSSAYSDDPIVASVTRQKAAHIREVRDAMK